MDEHIESREIHIERIVNGGYGMSNIDGRVVLVPYAAPGDILRVKPVGHGQERDRQGPFFEIIDIVRPSPVRRASRCPVFGECGGCDLDHLPYHIELDAKKGILVEDLRRIGGIVFEQPIDVCASASEYGYRNHAQVKIDAQGKLGFYRKKTHDIVPLPAQGCLLLQPSINRHLLELQGAMRQKLRHLQRQKPQHKGSIRIRANDEDRIFCKGDPRRDDDVHAVYTVGEFQFRIGVDDFFQVNRYLNITWVDRIVSYLEPDPRDTVLDLFCGSGLIALTLAPMVRDVIGIEANGSAVRNAEYNASFNGVDNARFGLGDLTSRTDISRWYTPTRGCLKVVVDPPRTGLDGKLIASIAQSKPAVVVYASCNSATFARDAKVWGECGYRPRSISIVDMFPRTRHIETVTLFVK